MSGSILNLIRGGCPTGLIMLVAACSSTPEPSIRIGVLLPLTGPSQLEFDKALDWAVDEVNQQGIRGRKLVLDYEDIGNVAEDPDGVAAAAQRFLDDPDVPAVIGTDYDDSTFKIAPSFLKAQKLLISPSATTAEITRAFGGKKFLWRTLESDVAQSELMVLHAKSSGAQKVAVLTTSDLYGETFFDWIPFYAEELELDVTGVARMKPDDADCSAATRRLARAGTPDLVFLVPGGFEQAKCMVQQARAIMPSARLMFSDGGQFEGLFQQLGSAAESVEGVSLEAYRDPAIHDPSYDSPFDAAYLTRFGKYPEPYAANAFDAVALLSYALDQSNWQPGEALADALKQVVDSRGETAAGEQTAGTGDGIRRALALIEQGKIPDVSGATGDLRFDPTLGTDLTATTYAIWQVKDGVQQWDEIRAGQLTLRYPENYFTRDERRSKFDTAANEALLSSQGESVTTAELPSRTGLWAFIAAFSSGWDNYRHQADALAMYQLLRARGLPDDHIVLMLADDIATDAKNVESGIVRNVGGGPNLRENAQIDYRLDQATTNTLVLRILSGQNGPDTPQVIGSGSGDDVFVFWVGHGAAEGIPVGASSAEQAEAQVGSLITPDALATTVNAMVSRKSYRRLLMVVESCHSGVMGRFLLSPNALLLTGAGPNENSLAANYDIDRAIWRADSFPWVLLSQLGGANTPSIADAYRQAFLTVRGSHVKMYNAAGFGPSSVDFNEFLSP